MDNKKNILLATIVLGSVIGFIEVAVKGLLNYKGVHLSGLIIGLDFIIIGIALAIFRKPLMVVAMGLIACLVKQLVVPLMCMPFMCQANSCLAIMLEFTTFTGMAALTFKRMNSSRKARILTAGTGIFLSSILFYSIGMQVRPCPYLLSFNVAGGFSSFLAREGMVWAIFAAALFPLGWEVGERLRQTTLSFFVQRPRVCYAGGGLISLFCWITSAVIICLGV